MQARSVLILIHVFVLAAAADANELSTACEAYGNADVVFVGRAQSPIKHTLVYDFGADRARKNLTEAEDELERHRISIGDPPTSPGAGSGRTHNIVRSDREREL